MKNFITVCVSVALGAALISPAIAQDAGPGKGGVKPGQGRSGGGGQGGAQMRGRMQQIETRVLGKMNLTAKQKADYKALNEKTQKDMQKLMSGTGTREQKMDKARAIQKSRQDGMNKIFTKAQQDQFRKLMAEEMKKLREERAKDGAQRGGGKPGAAKPGKAKP